MVMSALKFTLIVSLLLLTGCQPAGHPHGDASAEPLLRTAKGACLAKIVRFEEQDERPSDGDHWRKAWLEIDQASGEVPEYLYLVVEPGGLPPPEYQQQREKDHQSLLLRHNSLEVGERHWFVFADQYDSSKYPYQVAGWWRYADGDVPSDVIEAIDNDRFASRGREGHPD